MSSSKGQSFLALVVLVGSIIVSIGITIGFFAYSFFNNGYGYQAAASAEATAISGAEDGLLQLDRNPVFQGSYSLPVGSTTATVSIRQNWPSGNLVTVLSSSTVAGRTKYISVVLGENASTSQLNMVSWQEIP